MNQSRTPKGVPSGGEFSVSAHDETDMMLATGDDVVAVEWEDVVVGLPVEAREPVRRRLVEQGVSPADFESDDRDVAMWAGSVRGDVTFDGGLTSNAYALSSYAMPGSDEEQALRGRVLAPEGGVMGELNARWDELLPAEKLAYVDGYAAATTAVVYARSVADGNLGGGLRRVEDTRPSWDRIALRDRGRSAVAGGDREMQTGERLARRAGWVRGVNAAYFEDSVASGRLGDGGRVRISDSDVVGKNVEVDHVVKLTGPGSANAYVGTVVASDTRRYSVDDETLPVNQGARIRFTVDQYIGTERT